MDNTLTYTHTQTIGKSATAVFKIKNQEEPLRQSENSPLPLVEISAEPSSEPQENSGGDSSPDTVDESLPPALDLKGTRSVASFLRLGE